MPDSLCHPLFDAISWTRQRFLVKHARRNGMYRECGTERERSTSLETTPLIQRHRRRLVYSRFQPELPQSRRACLGFDAREQSPAYAAPTGYLSCVQPLDLAVLAKQCQAALCVPSPARVASPAIESRRSAPGDTTRDAGNRHRLGGGVRRASRSGSLSRTASSPCSKKNPPGSAARDCERSEVVFHSRSARPTRRAG
jgi:hypothetical protein